MEALRRYQEADVRLQEIQLKRLAVEREISAILTTINEKKEDQTDPVQDAAERLLQGEDVVRLAKETDFDPNLSQLKERRTILGRAIGLQKEKVEAFRREAQREAWEHLAPKYRALIKETAAAVVEVAKLTAREVQLIHEHFDAVGLSCNHNRGFFLGVGMIDEETLSTPVMHYLKSLVTDGFLTEKEARSLTR